MARFFRLSLLLAALGLMAAPAMANIPDKAFSTVPGQLTIVPDFGPWPSPDINNITVAGSGGTIASAAMEIVVASDASDLLCWCGGSPNGLTGTADGSGEWKPVPLGGGCVLNDDNGAHVPGSVLPNAIIPATVFADAVNIGEINTINSPDVVNGSGLRVVQDDFEPDSSGGHPICSVALGDAVYHTPAIINSLAQRCSFYNPNLAYTTGVSLFEANVVTNYVLAASSCQAD